MTAVVWAALLLGQLSGKEIDLNPTLENVDIDDVPVQEALTRLFKANKIPFKIAREVRGNVSLSLKGKFPFWTVLRNICRQVDSYHEVRNGTYLVFFSEATPSGEKVALFPFAGITGQMAIDRVFSEVPFKYVIKDQLHAPVNVSFPDGRPMAFEAALRAVLDTLKADYQVHQGVYYIQKGQVSRPMRSKQPH